LPKTTRPIHSSWPWRLHGVKPHRRVRKGKHFYVIECRKRWFRLTWWTYHGYCITGHYAKGAHPLLGHVPVTEREFPQMGIKKRESKAKDLKHLAAVESELLSGRMSLVEHCSLMQYEDGTPRVPGWFSVGTQGAAWAVTVKDPDTCSSFRSVAPTLDAAIDLAAMLLAADDAPWEADKWLADAQKRNSKK